MIPIVADDLQADFEYVEEPSHTFRLNTDQSTITGFADEREAMKQAIYLILNIERYEHLIYNWDYGVELQDLFGQPRTFVLPELKRRLTEALLQDARIISVDNFMFISKKETILITFTANTIYGEIEAERIVII